jgi:dTDP-glucose 4,6-dehydratase
MGTLNILNMSLEHNCRLLHVSTDEVYGSLNLDENSHFYEFACYRPNSLYAASKACSDLLVLSYHSTYNLNCNITNSCNNFGPYQQEDKLIPTIIRSLVNKKRIPVYGDGKNVRDWLAVGDHVAALDLIFHNGKAGEKYNIGTNNEISNIELVNIVCRLYDVLKNNEDKNSADLISFVEDRDGVDLRYSINADKLKNKLRWKPKKVFNTELYNTVKFYIDKYESNSSL